MVGSVLVWGRSVDGKGSVLVWGRSVDGRFSISLG